MKKETVRGVCAPTDTAMGNQCQSLNESAAVDELSHSGRYFIHVALIHVTDTHEYWQRDITIYSPL